MMNTRRVLLNSMLPMALMAGPGLALASSYPDIYGDSGFWFKVDNGYGMMTGKAYDSSVSLLSVGDIDNSLTSYYSSSSIDADGRMISFTGKGMASGITVTRNFYVPSQDAFSNGDYGRYLDCLKNTSGHAIRSVSVVVKNIYTTGYNSSTNKTSSGDSSFTASDSWITTNGYSNYQAGEYPGFAFGNGAAAASTSYGGGSTDTIQWSFSIPLFATDQKMCFLTYAILADSPDNAATMADQLLKKPDLNGISSEDLPYIVNFQKSKLQVETYPKTGKTIPSAVFDGLVNLTGDASTLDAGSVSVNLNGKDITASCLAPQTLLNLGGTSETGRVVRCPLVSRKLLKGKKNIFTATFTGPDKGTASSTSEWEVYPSRWP